MIYEDPQALRERINEVTRREASKRVNVFEDTSEFMVIDAGSVLRIGGSDYLVLGQAREGRFGIDEQPKFWVKSCIDLATGAKKFIKLVYRERFQSRIGRVEFQCMRSPEKESEVLSRMRGHPNFMQGRSVRDAVGNLVRVTDFVPGRSLYWYLHQLDMPHEAYYRLLLPDLMEQVIKCVEAIIQLHRQELNHGDIRADHLIMNDKADTWVWVDFDYEADYPDYDLFCLGNVLQQVVGKGRHSIHDIRLRQWFYPDFKDTLVSSDMSLMFPHRVINLRKLFPHISDPLNEILMRFSTGTRDTYDRVEALLDDLRSLFPTVKGKWAEPENTALRT